MRSQTLGMFSLLRHPAPTKLITRSFSTTIITMAPQEFKLKGISSLDLPPGHKEEVEVEGIENGKVLLLNTSGTVQAVGAKCTHYGAPLAKGVLTKSGRLTCPWHGACFNAKTGDVEDAPALDNLPVFKVTKRDGAVYLSGEESAIKSSRRKPNFKCSIAGKTPTDKVLVVGGGSGAIGLIEGLREKGYRGHITVISNEGNLPIDRTRLSKALVTDVDKLSWRDNAWFDSGSVQWVDGDVNQIDFTDKLVMTRDGSKHSYTKLVLATGGTPRKLPIRGFNDLGNIFTLRNVKDVQNIVAAIGEEGKKIVVVGSSFIGLEIAVATCAANSVTMIGMEKVPLERVLGQEVGGGLQKFLEGKGIKFHMASGVERADPSSSDPSKVGAVCLQDGAKLEADLVVLGVGVAPATEFLRDNQNLQLERDGSIKTDKNFSVVGLKDVYAIGDISTFPYHGPGGDGRPTRIEHWNVAQNSGRVVASHIISPNHTANFIPIFWSAVGAQLRYCGNTSGGWDDLIIEGKPEETKFLAYYTQGETVIAMASMGWDPAMAMTVELMRSGRMLTKNEIQANPDITKLGPLE